MRFLKTTAASAALAAALMLVPAAPAAAAPLSPATATALGAAAKEASPVIEVQRRGRYYGGYRGGRGYRGGGAGLAAGIAAGALLGGVIASQAAPRYYYDAPVYYGRPAVDPAIEYCMRRFRSYDPRTMTYMGYDGIRRSCP